MSKEEYENKIISIVNNDFSNKNELLIPLLDEYYKFCYDNKINTMIPGFYQLLSSSYIIDSEPKIFDVSKAEVVSAVAHLKRVQENLKNNVTDGISLEEAKILLDWDVQNARKILGETVPIETNSLDGLCGYGQMLTMIPFNLLDVKTTINNVSSFPLAKFRHGFGTVTFPIKDNNSCYQKQFLLDVTYRQFFSTFLCVYGRYYINNMDYAPSAGYYVCQFLEGKKFASNLLKNGYIELSSKNALIYGRGFEYEGVTPYTRDNKAVVDARTGEDYIQVINNVTEELDITEEEYLNMQERLTFPHQFLSR